MTENAIMAIAVSAPFVALFVALGVGDIGKPAAEAAKERARADVEIERLRLEAERLRLVYAHAERPTRGEPEGREGGDHG